MIFTLSFLLPILHKQVMSYGGDQSDTHSHAHQLNKLQIFLSKASHQSKINGSDADETLIRMSNFHMKHMSD